MSDFLGQYNYSLDEKGRVSIPARFRREMSPEARETFIVTIGHDKCLFAYPLDQWERKSAILREQPMSNDEARMWVRWVSANATQAICDKQGRIMIPPHLIELARLEKDVVINGVLDRLEIWNPDLFVEYTAEMEEKYEEYSKEVQF